jgi:hypothetical protein
MGSKRQQGAPSRSVRPHARSVASDRKTYLMHGKVSQCTGFTFTTVIFIMVFRSLCSLYSTAYKMPLLSVHNILGRAGGRRVCSSLHYYNITLLQRHKAAYFTIFTAIVFSARRSRPFVCPPSSSARHARACVCVNVR